MRLHERLRQLRLENNLRLADVRELSGYHVSHLSNLEHDYATPLVETLSKLSKAFQVTIQKLLAPVDFYGSSSNKALPKALAELCNDPVIGGQITPEWVKILEKVEFKGVRPSKMMDYYDIFRVLKRISEAE